MLDDISQRLQSSLVLVARGNRMPFRFQTILLIRHQDRDLSTEFCQLERTCRWQNVSPDRRQTSPSPNKCPRRDLQAMAVMHEPAVAPAAPNVATVQRFGYVPFVLTCFMTSKPKVCLTQLQYVYLVRW